jgi:hypothetical protein
MIRCFATILLMTVLSANAAEWEDALATTASLRTAGARLVSSDVLKLEDGESALITYWEARNRADLDVYRCVDVVAADFAPLRQMCWKVLTPDGRRSAEAG